MCSPLPKSMFVRPMSVSGVRCHAPIDIKRHLNHQTEGVFWFRISRNQVFLNFDIFILKKAGKNMYFRDFDISRDFRESSSKKPGISEFRHFYFEKKLEKQVFQRFRHFPRFQIITKYRYFIDFDIWRKIPGKSENSCRNSEIPGFLKSWTRTPLLKRHLKPCARLFIRITWNINKH